MQNEQAIKSLLDELVVKYNKVDFIKDDPISIPHRFDKLQDIEIIGFWTAMLAWGQRKTIIKSADKLINLMDGAPHDFILNHQEEDLKRFESFKHRTFQPIDALYFMSFFKTFYKNNNSLEEAFLYKWKPDDENTKNALIGFQEQFFNLPFAPQRTKKHVASPARKSSCKRLNMFLRWMVRQDDNGVDFGLWKTIKPSQLIIPLDVHVDRVARQLGLLQRKQTDWQAAVELTKALKQFEPNDPVKYDFALFGAGVLQQDEQFKYLKSQ